jgi:hypothetical protein
MVTWVMVQRMKTRKSLRDKVDLTKLSQPLQDGREKDVRPFYLHDLGIEFTFLLAK